MACRHKQTTVCAATKADIRASFRQCDPPDRRAVGCKDHDAVQFGVTHAPAAPKVAVDIAPHPVGRSRAGVDVNPLVGEFRPVYNIIGKDLAAGLSSTFHKVEDGFVWREAQAIGARDIFCNDVSDTGDRVNAVNVLR